MTFRSLQRLGLDYVLPLVVSSLTDLTTSHEAADVLNKFDSNEVQFLFQRILQEDADGVFFVKPVFEYLASETQHSWTSFNTTLAGLTQ